MVFVQSFWSKPFLNLDSNDMNYRVSGGFIDKRYFYYCWALSYLHLKKLGEKVVLFTDDHGQYLFADVLGFAYDEVHLDFNALADLSSSYWAIPKLVTYNRMREPFLHVDGDLIIYPGFMHLNVEDKDLVFEFKNDAFSEDHFETIRHLNGIVFEGHSSGEAAELNCGVVGGKDYRFLNDFGDYSLKLFYRNLGKLETDRLRFNKNMINSYFEQYLLFRFVCKREKDFCCLYENNPREIYMRDFFLAKSNSSRILTHFFLNLKSKYSLEIETALRLNYPEWHRKINDLIERNII
jgi:hypothetical protein